jgi:predicted  nucleic acid-binding Zn-ribbon protein
MWPDPGLEVPYGREWTREQELEALKNQAKYFEETLNNINQRLKDLEGNARDKGIEVETE